MATDAATGQNPGQNQKVGTTDAVIKQGEKVFNGIYKRTYRAMKKEFRLIYRLNYLAKPVTGKFDYTDGSGQGGFALWTDYFESNKAVVPAADPTIASKEELLERDGRVLQLAMQVPGFNKYEVVRRMLANMEVPGIDKIFPQPGTPGAPPPPPPPPAVQVAQIKAQSAQNKNQTDMRMHQLELMETARLNQAKILNLDAQSLKLKAEAGATGDQTIIAMMDQEVQAAKAFQDILSSSIKSYTDVFAQTQGAQNAGSPNAGAVGGMAPPGGNPGVPSVPPDAGGGSQGGVGAGPV
jgi:hypothetical protein